MMKKLINSEHLETKANGWIFLSHSSDDYQNVKWVRNYLEDHGFSAIMFYLKCYDDAKGKHREKVQKLIECEIKNRNIFVLCDSTNARKSKFVQREISIVKKQKHIIYLELDLDNFKERKKEELDKLDILLKKATLFFSYSMQDKEKVNVIYQYLSNQDFKILLDSLSINIGDNISESIFRQIKIASQDGAVLLFLSQNSFNSRWFWNEKDMALTLNAPIIPILLDEIKIEEFPALRNLEFIDASNGFGNKEKKQLVRVINQRRISNEME